MTSIARYRIQHQTKYHYSQPVAICQNQLRMLPQSRNSKLTSVEVQRVQLTISPEPIDVNEHTDYFGNRVHTFSIETSHQELEVSARSELTIECQPLQSDKQESIVWENTIAQVHEKSDPNWCQVQEYCFDSPAIRRSESFAAYATESFTDGRGILDAVGELTKRIHDDFEYDTNATDVATPVEKSFQMRAGVCQDFAQIQLACLRSIGVPARYVSGYIRTIPPEGQPKLVGVDESHAWVSVYLGANLGWVDFDPTNACRCELNHIPIAIGREYSEVTPMRGVVLGGGTAQLTVQVTVESLS